MKLAVSSYSFGQYIYQGKMTQLDVVKKSAEMGFSGIDFIDLCPDIHKTPTTEEQLEYADAIRSEAEKYGMEIVAYTIGANLYNGSAEADAVEIERLKKQVDIASLLGAKLLRHDICHTEKQGGKTVSYDQMLPVIAKNARMVTEYARTKGIRTCSENHGFIAQDSDRMERLYSAVAHENYGLLIDIGNFACVDENPVLAVSRLAPYAIHVHAKDFRIRPFGFVPEKGEGSIISRGCNLLSACAIGEGDIPVAQCIAILRRAGYDGFLTLEYEGAADCLEGILKSMESLKRYI